MKKLFVFDMDGTLLPKTTSLLEIAKVIGKIEEMESLETQYYQKQIDPMTLAKSIHEFCKTVSHEIVRSAFELTPKLNNIREVLKRIMDEGNVSCLVTASPNFFADHFYDYGFDNIFASRPFSLNEDHFTPEHIIFPKDKPVIVKQLCEKLQIPFEQTVAFGDSLTDVPLFQSLKHTISVNGDHHIKDHAKHYYTGMDLMEAYLLHLL